MSKIFPLILGGLALAGLVSTSCTTVERWVILPNLSPAVVAIAGSPMNRAEAVAKTIPHGFILVAHGTAAFSLYLPGTVLVIQPIDWEHLRPGMTAIYYIDEELTAAALTGGVITRQEDGGWRVPGAEAWHPPGTGSHADTDLLTKSRYIGVVAAAFIAKDHYDLKVTLRETPPDIAGTCALRCHVTTPP